MRRASIWMVGFVVAGMLAVGCAKASSTAPGATAATTAAACQGPEYSVCVNGKPIDFAADLKPHGHETGSIYAPVDVLADQLHLDVKWNISTDGKEPKVLLNGKAFAPAMADGSKGIHVHNGHVFVPVKEFAAAAGLKLDWDATKHLAGFAH